MKVFSKIKHDNFSLLGEVEEQLPYNKEGIILKDDLTSFKEIFKLDYNSLDTNLNQGLLQVQGINIEDNCLKFAGNNTSFIKLNGSLLNNKKDFEIKIKFKLDDLSTSIRTLLSIKQSNKENMLNIIVDRDHRLIYADMLFSSGAYNTEYTFKPGTSYKLTDIGAIEPGVWYELSFLKADGIITVHLNNMLKESFIFQDRFQAEEIYIGQEVDLINNVVGLDNDQAFKGLIEYVEIIEYKDVSSNSVYNINPNLSGDFTVSYDWLPTSINSNSDLFKFEAIKLNNTGNKLTIFNNNVKVCEADVFEDNLYTMIYSYKAADIKQLTLKIYNRTTCKLIAQGTLNNWEFSNTNIEVLLNKDLSNLICYLGDYSEKLLSYYAKRFAMYQDGNIYYGIDERESNFRFRDSYLINMDDDLNSSCNVIQNNSDDAYFAYGAVKAGMINTAFKAINEDEAMPYNNSTWDQNLNKDAYSMPGWERGFNNGVSNPETGFHAKIVKEGMNNNEICGKLINKNGQFGNLNRWIGIVRELPYQSESYAGKTVKVVFRAVADTVGSKLYIGIYRKQLSDKLYGFGDNRKLVAIKTDEWGEYSYECNIDSDWDLNFLSKLYFYGHYSNKECSISIQDVYIMIDEIMYPIDVLKDTRERKVKLNFSNQILLDYNSNWSINYMTKIFKENHMDFFGQKLGWGIDNAINKIYISKDNFKTYITPSYDLKEILNKWINVCFAKNNSDLYVQICTPLGIHSIKIGNVSIDSLYSEEYGYDIIFSGKDDIVTSCALYKNFIITKEFVPMKKIEDHYRNKFSYYKNQLFLNANIIENDI